MYCEVPHRSGSVCDCVCECEQNNNVSTHVVLNSLERGEGGVGAKARHQSPQPMVANVILTQATLLANVATPPHTHTHTHTHKHIYIYRFVLALLCRGRTHRSLNFAQITAGPELEMLAAWLATNPALTDLE